MKKKAVFIWTGFILLLLLITGIAAASYYLNMTRKAIGGMTADDDSQVFFSVYVLAGDPASSLEDTREHIYGVYKSDPYWKGTRQTVSLIEERLKQPVETKEYENIFIMADMLQAQKCNAILINEAYMDGIREAKGFEWTREGLKKIGRFVYSEKDDKKNSVPAALPTKFTVYISGIDTFGGISARSRSDVNILAFVDTADRELLLISTPRDYYVTYNGTDGRLDKLTHAGIYGVGASVNALERLYDIDVDYFVRMNFTGFMEVIDALGGIDVYSEYDFRVENVRHFEKGYNHVTGEEALAFARERYSFTDGDYQRGRNQMEVIKAVINKCTSSAILTNYTSVMEALAGSFETNMPKDQITALVTRVLTGGGSWSMESFHVNGTADHQETFSMPGQELFVIIPNQESIEEAKTKIKAVMESAAS